MSELEELVKAAGDSITWLFKISIVLRNPAPFDRYQEAEFTGRYDPDFDIDYVRNTVPYLQRAGSEWLIERLGQANSRRRELFNYREKHRKRLGYVPPDQSVSPEDEDSSQAPRTINTAPSSSTTATTFNENLAFRSLDFDEKDTETVSVTSYATSAVTDSEGKTRIPRQPAESRAAKPFECPFCYTIQVVEGEHSWRYITGPKCQLVIAD